MSGNRCCWAHWNLRSYATIASILLIGSVITLVRLYRTAGINETQRIAASWMACYMLLATATLVSPPSLRGMHKLTMDRP